jgi:hypothetical protein
MDNALLASTAICCVYDIETIRRLEFCAASGEMADHLRSHAWHATVLAIPVHGLKARASY